MAFATTWATTHKIQYKYMRTLKSCAKCSYNSWVHSSLWVVGKARGWEAEGPCKVEPSMGPILVKPEVKMCDNLCFVVHEDLSDFILFYFIFLHEMK